MKTQKKVLTKNGTLISPNSGEDQKKKKEKKVFTKKGTLFSLEFKWTPTLRCTPESKYWKGCRCTPYSTQTIGGDTAKLLGGINSLVRKLSKLSKAVEQIHATKVVTYGGLEGGH